MSKKTHSLANNIENSKKSDKIQQENIEIWFVRKLLQRFEDELSGVRIPAAPSFEAVVVI